MPANVDAMVREGQNAFKSGNKEDARALLMKAAELDPYNEDAWLWLSAVVDGVDDQRTCLENVLAINPQNERARKGLDALTQQGSSAPPTATSASSASYGGSSTSVEWDLGGGLPTSSASAQPSQPELSDEDYDNWLSNLNLPQSTGSPNTTSAESIASSPFGDANIFDDEDDMFSGGPFSAADMEDVFTPNAPASAPAQQAAPPPPASPSPAVPASKMSPGREQNSKSNFFEDEDVEVNPIFANFEEEYTDEDLSELNADELFSYIPMEIQPTRLPGTREGSPVMVILGIVVLLVLNIGAAVLLVSRLAG